MSHPHLLDQPSLPSSHGEPEALSRATHDVPGPDELARVAALFKLLGDPTRAKLLYALRAAGELAVCDLAQVTDLAEATVSQALRLLRASGVVAGRRDGRHVVYSLLDEHVQLLLDVTRHHSQHVEAPR